MSHCLCHPCLSQDLEVTVTVSDSPLSAKTEQVVATPTAASEAGGSSTVTSFRPRHTSHTEAAASGGDKGEGVQPDASGMLPKDDAMVYGGMVLGSLGLARLQLARFGFGFGFGCKQSIGTAHQQLLMHLHTSEYNQPC